MTSHSKLRFTLISVRSFTAMLLAIGLGAVTPASAQQYNYLDFTPNLSTNYADGQYYNLPGYGNVGITLSNTSASPYYAVNGATPPYTPALGTVPVNTTTLGFGYDIGMAAPPYQTTFYVEFSFPTLPDLSKLAIAVSGLGYGTFIQPSSGVSLLGQANGAGASDITDATLPILTTAYAAAPYSPAYTISAPLPIPQAPGAGSTTSTPDYIYSTLDGDPRNTGWSLWQSNNIDSTPNLDSTNLMGNPYNLYLGVTAEAGDGWGVSLAYATPEPSSRTLVVAALATVACLSVLRLFRRGPFNMVLGAYLWSRLHPTVPVSGPRPRLLALFNLFRTRIGRTLVNTRSYRLAKTAALAAALLCAPTEKAVAVTFTATGSMSSAYYAIPVGAPFQVTLSYATPATQPSTLGESLSIFFPGYGTISDGGTGTIYMTAGPPTTYQLYDVSTSVTPDPTFTQPLPTQMTFMLQELPPPDLTSLQWPYPNLPGSLSLSEFSLGAASFIQLDDFATNTIGIGEFNPVPEPSTIALALTGLLAVLFKCLSSGRVRAGTTPSSIRSGALALCAPLAAGLAVPLLHRRRHSGR